MSSVLQIFDYAIAFIFMTDIFLRVQHFNVICTCIIIPYYNLDKTIMRREDRFGRYIKKKLPYTSAEKEKVSLNEIAFIFYYYFDRLLSFTLHYNMIIKRRIHDDNNIYPSTYYYKKIYKFRNLK